MEKVPLINLRHARRIPFQLALLTLVLGLLLLTVGCIGAVGYFNSWRSVTELKRKYYGLMSSSVAREVTQLLQPAAQNLRELSTLSERGLLPLDDFDALGVLLAERLRQRQNLSWLSYGDRNGRFVGVWRQGDTVVLNRSSPDIDGGRPRETIISADGLRAPLDRHLAGYDPRIRDWYVKAMLAGGIVWSGPYVFNEGHRGITAALKSCRPGDSEPAGVFTADYFLSSVSAYLQSLTSYSRGCYVVLARDGMLIGDSASEGGEADPLLAAAVAAMPKPMKDLPLDQSVYFQFSRQRTSYDAVFTAYRVHDGFECITGIISPEDEFLGAVYSTAKWTAVIGGGALLVAAALANLIAYRIAAPLHRISGELEQVGHFHLGEASAPLPSSFIQEIAIVSQSVDHMKAGLRSFGRYVPKGVVRELLLDGQEARLGGQLRELTIYFSDIENFTGISERMSPSQIVAELADYLDLMVSILDAHSGTLDKIMGDGLLSFFNAPGDVSDHAAKACHAALAAQSRLAAIAPQRAAAGKPVFRTRIGLHTGEVLVGNIGTPSRFAYTVMGDGVNLASRLEGLNKLYGTYVLCSDSVRAAAGEGKFEWRTLDRVAVVGRTEGTLIHELMPEKDQAPANLLEARDLYEAGLRDYFALRFDTAAALFRDALILRPADRAAATLLQRIEVLEARENLTAETWTGIYVATSK